jgi:hypothetical protein
VGARRHRVDKAAAVIRSKACNRITPAKIAAAPPDCICEITCRSIPPAKSFLAEVITTPRTAPSPKARSIKASSAPIPASDKTFIDRPATSHVMVATPSLSRAYRKSVIIWFLVLWGADQPGHRKEPASRFPEGLS